MRGLSAFILIVFVTISAVEAKSSQSRTVPNPAVPRPAPEFLWAGVNGQVRRLRDLRGHPVVLIFAEQPSQKMFYKQIKELNRRAKELIARYTLFFVAFTKETGLVERTNIPFVILPDPQAVADAYRVGDFGIAVISTDGNVDYATDRVITGQKVLDVIVNSYENQVRNRRI
ncbi:MAG: redoxin domain-containing protein [Verrucomicrobia bacterium]|nr:redoxin domain-containing protein [Verrucomicrobiota bacterium]MBV9673311.1 redoxin domain-containing protein [Verrucomicrobiota bacterium]